MKNNLDTKNLHKDHRKRVKKRFLNTGFESFEKHEMLELLLYYSIPRKDTNAIAHRLIDTFGSLSAVFDAPVEKLCEVDGISEHTAVLIKMIPQLAREYAADIDLDKKSFSDYFELGEFFVSKFLGETKEKLYAAFFDNGMHMLDCIKLSEGNINSTDANIRSLSYNAIRLDCSFVALAHNHPNSLPIPSVEDLDVTKACRLALKLVDVELVEHYIVSGGRFMGVVKQSGDTQGF